MQIPYLLRGLFKPFKARPSSTTFKSLTNTRWCWGIKPGWLFPCVEWYPCQLFILHSRSTSSRWSKHYRLAIRKGTKFFMFHFSIGRGRKNSKSNTCIFVVNIGCLRMRDLSFSCLPIWTSSFFSSACLLFGMGITSWRLGCLTLTIYTMMNLEN